MAGVVAATANNMTGIAGIGWNIRILPVRALGKCGGSLADIAEAIRWAAGLPVPGVPTNPTPARVINLSLGGATEPDLRSDDAKRSRCSDCGGRGCRGATGNDEAVEPCHRPRNAPG